MSVITIFRAIPREPSSLYYLISKYFIRKIVLLIVVLINYTFYNVRIYIADLDNQHALFDTFFIKLSNILFFTCNIKGK